ncbi:MAG: rRNA synthase [Patescibacteria group bacterium]|nr:rRNA synthase [Patescibacteria group bacterium]
MKTTYQGEYKQRLDIFLSEQNPDVSRSQIKKIIINGQVSVNDQVPTVHFWLKKNDVIVYDLKNQRLEDTVLTAPKIKKETADYVVIEKPSGLLVHPTDKGEKNTLVTWLVKNYPQIKKIDKDTTRTGLVQRLDKDVSGLMVIPLSKKFFDDLKQQFVNRQVFKEYLCLVNGQVLNDTGEIKSNLARDKKTGLTKIQLPGEGAEAHTLYEVVTRYINCTLLKVQIKTGRTHQIRAHLFSIGHSVVGDKLYQTKDVRKKKKQAEIRIFLHSHLLKFLGPDQKIVKTTSALPKELKDYLKTLK